MAELDHMAAELSENKYVSRIERGTTGSVRFDTDYGEYNSLPSTVMSIIGRYDCVLYTDKDLQHGFKYWAMVE